MANDARHRSAMLGQRTRERNRSLGLHKKGRTSNAQKEAERRAAGTTLTLQEAFRGVASRKTFVTHFLGVGESAGYRFFVPNPELFESGPHIIHWKRAHTDPARTPVPCRGATFEVALASGFESLFAGTPSSFVIRVDLPPLPGFEQATQGGETYIRTTTGSLMATIVY